MQNSTSALCSVGDTGLCFLLTLASDTQAACGGEKKNLFLSEMMDSKSYAWFTVAQGQEPPLPLNRQF